MLTQIVQIKNIRNFHNFSCSEKFSQKNVIYALNGSGKTNLSRFLNVFRQPDLKIESFENLRSLEAKRNNLPLDFELLFNETEFVNLSGLKLPVKSKILVYNKEFLDKNVSINDFSDKIHNGKIQLGIIGESQTEIEKLTKRVGEIEELGRIIKEKCTNELNNRAGYLQRSTKGRLLTFTEYLKYENFNQKYIDALRNKIELQVAANKFETISKIDDTDRINTTIPTLSFIDFNAINAILFPSNKFEEIEKEVESHISAITKIWVQAGLEFHRNEGKDLCPFCRQSTSSIDTIRKYNEYIESKRAKTIGLIDSFIINLSSVSTTILENQKLIDGALGKKVVSYIELFGLNKESFNQSIGNPAVIDQIKCLSDFLKVKKDNLDSSFDDFEKKEIEEIIPPLSKQLEIIGRKCKGNNLIISLINTKISDTGTQKSILRKQMAQWALIEYYEENKSELESLRNSLIETKKKLEDESAKLPQKGKKELIIKLLNKALQVAGLFKYSVDENFHLFLSVSDDSNFDITAETQLVSDGEKSVIAFTYYIASILQEIDKFEDLKKITLVIDDPISSMSYNYLHGIGVVIKKLSILFQEVSEKNCTEIPQLIILTHNLQFYNLLFTNIFKKEWSERVKKNSFFTLFIKDGNPILEKENNLGKLSEYMTSLNRVYKFNNGILEENIGNDIRKIIETICSFHFLNLSHENLEKIFDCKINTNLKLIADDFVHTDFNNFEDPLPMIVLKEASEELLSLIELKFNSQYEQIAKISL